MKEVKGNEPKTYAPLTEGMSTLLQNFRDLGPQAPQLILETATTHVQPMLRWEAVRKDRGPKLLGQLGNATGFEGLSYRPTVTANEMQYVIAAAVETELSADVRLHPGDIGKRNRRERVLYNRNFGDLRALKELEDLFIQVKSRIRREQIQTKTHEKAFEQFRTETVFAVKQAGTVSFSFNPETGSFEQQIHVPSIRTEALQTGFQIPYSQTGYEYASQLGIVGHPIIRVVLSVPELVAYHELRHPNGRVNLAPRSGELYQFMKDRLEVNLIGRYLSTY